ncbi:unnamed protein product, partial [Mesorhabditis belari]|uniref:Uncharacterized protein n=1 Tax=Mesorhabditis belari TaxID=2138241 RepID=A0AAF3J2F3_9BILA
MSENPAGMSDNPESSSIENGVLSARDEETRKLEKTLKSYRKFCAEKETRKTLLKDAAFLKMLTQCMTDNRPSVMKYLIQILLLLTEKKEDATFLGTVEGLVKAIGLAQEGPFTPNDY